MGLTYPQCELTPEDFALGLAANPKTGGYSKFVIGVEEHEDGGQHFHAYLHYPTKLHVRDSRAWDIEGYHPNIIRFSGKNPQGSIDKWISYCKKGGDWSQGGFLKSLFTFIHHDNYRKKKQDLLQWEQDAKEQQLIDPFPFSLPNDFKIIKPVKDEDDIFIKRRHWLLLGPPDCGKTWWINNEFKGKKVHIRPKDTKYGGPFELNTYSGAQVVIYDDTVLKLEELIDVANIWELKVQTYGAQRYQNNYWPIGQARVIIWMLNPESLPDYAKVGNARYNIFKARFRFLNYYKNDYEDEQDPVTAWQEIDDSPVQWSDHSHA